MSRQLIIAIDGPSGAGKSTLGRMLARAMNVLYIDTGAMYRAAALAVKEAGISTLDQERVTQIVESSNINLEGDPDALQVMLGNRNITDEIRTAEISQLSSMISTITGVRRALVSRQQRLGQHGGVVLEGRDIGTVVFPDADIKFFLTAAPEARARRRYEENKSREHESSFHQTLADIVKRDLRDTTRADSPLTVAKGAIVIDTTSLSLDEVFDRMMVSIRALK